MSLVDSDTAALVVLLVPKMGADAVRDVLKDLKVQNYLRCAQVMVRALAVVVGGALCR